MKYVTQDATLGDDADATVVPDKTLIDKEKQNLEKMKVGTSSGPRLCVGVTLSSFPVRYISFFLWFQGVLQMFLHDHVDLQIAALYAAQVFCYSQGFPKGNTCQVFVISERVRMIWYVGIIGVIALASLSEGNKINLCRQSDVQILILILDFLSKLDVINQLGIHLLW